MHTTLWIGEGLWDFLAYCEHNLLLTVDLRFYKNWRIALSFFGICSLTGIHGGKKPSTKQRMKTNRFFFQVTGNLKRSWMVNPRFISFSFTVSSGLFHLSLVSCDGAGVVWRRGDRKDPQRQLCVYKGGQRGEARRWQSLYDVCAGLNVWNCFHIVTYKGFGLRTYLTTCCLGNQWWRRLADECVAYTRSPAIHWRDILPTQRHEKKTWTKNCAFTDYRTSKAEIDPLI